MAIRSNAFGRVTLTGSDAKKFRAQVAHGKPKAAAVEAVKRGVAMSKALRKKGEYVIPAKKRG